MSFLQAGGMPSSLVYFVPQSSMFTRFSMKPNFVLLAAARRSSVSSVLIRKLPIFRTLVGEENIDFRNGIPEFAAIHS